MIVHPASIPLAFLAGIVFAGIYRCWLARKNPDLWYLGYGTVLVLWGGLVGWPTLLPGGTIVTTSFVLALAYPLSYPLWYRFGAAVTFFLVGRRPSEGGSLWIYLPFEYSGPFEPRWDAGSEQQPRQREQ